MATKNAPLVTLSTPIRQGQLRAFHAVATHRSFTLAARALGVSQPAVSQHVRGLEEAFGVELFRRANREITLTELGVALLDRVRSMLALETSASELLAAESALLRGHLRVGADAPYFALPLLARYREAHPDVQLSLTLGNSSDVLRALLDGVTDVAALSDRIQDPRLFAIPAARHAQVLLVAKSHPWAKRASVRLGELDGAPMLLREPGSATRLAFERVAARASVRPTIVMELGSREAIGEGVAAGLGVAVVIESERGHDARLVALPLADATIEHVDYVATLHERRKLRAIAAFLELVPRLRRGGVTSSGPTPRARSHPSPRHRR